jgi:DNA-binding transcriptional ArsR family regulator
MHLDAKLIAGFCFLMATIPIPRTLSAQQKEAAAGTPVDMVVSVEPKHGNEVPSITQQDVIVNQGHDRRPVTSWVRATGDRAGLELAILIDDSAGFSFASQMADIRAFITEQAPTTSIAVGYMRNGTVSLAQNFTQDHAAASKSVRLPQGFIGAEASPYFSLTDFIKRWPANPSAPRREVLMITSGIDTFYGGGYPDPYVDKAVEDAQCAGVVVFSIYTPGAGHFGHTYWRIYWGQNYLAQLSEETGGESYYFLGAQAPVAFQPYRANFKAEFFKALAHPVRIRILDCLRDGEKSVNELSQLLRIEPANVSQQLAIMRVRNIVIGRKSGSNVYYSVSDTTLFKLLDVAKNIFNNHLVGVRDMLQQIKAAS